MGPLGRDAEQDWALSRVKPRSHLGLGKGRNIGQRAEPKGHHVDFLRRDPEQMVEVRLRRGRIDQDAVGTAGSKRHEHSHSQPEHAQMGLRHDSVAEIVDCDDTPVAPPRRGGAPQTVQEIDTGPMREPGQQLLLSAHPFEAITGSHRNGHRRDQLSPWPPGRRRRLAVDECGEAHLRRGRDELFGQE